MFTETTDTNSNCFSFCVARATPVSIWISFNIYISLPAQLCGGCPPKQMDDFEWVTSNEGVWSTDRILQNHTTDEVSFYPSAALGVPKSFGPDMHVISPLHLCPKTLALNCMSLSRNQPRAGCLWSILVYIWIHVIFRFSTKSPSAQLASVSVSYIVDIFHTWTRRKLLKENLEIFRQ